MRSSIFPEMSLRLFAFAALALITASCGDSGTFSHPDAARESAHAKPSGRDPVVRIVVSEVDPLAVVVRALAPTSQFESVIARSLFKLRAAGADQPELDCTLDSSGPWLSLEPRQPLLADTDYVATLELPDGRKTEARYHTPKPDPDSKAAVKCVYPRGNAIPANNLHFFVQFNKRIAPRDDLFKFFAIEDDAGVEVKAPFLMTPMWSPDCGRLTLRIHPSRIKHDLRDVLGMVLVPGHKFTLVVKPGLRSVDGGTIETEFRKTYDVGQEDRKPILPQEWLCDLPRVGSKDALVVHFGEPLNVAMARTCLTVFGPDSEIVDGDVTLGDNDDAWSFTPSRPWQDGTHRLQTAELLEDLAGNRPGVLFDRGRDDPPYAPILERSICPVAK